MNDFFAALYEGFHPLNLFYIQDFSNEMYDSGAYVTIGVIMIFSSLILMTLYYYLLSSYGNLYKRLFWFIWLLIIAIINFAVAYYYSIVELENLQLNYGFTEHFNFSIVNVLWTVIFSFLFSLILKFKSIQGSRTPF
jgi:hypothetical protein